MILKIVKNDPKGQGNTSVDFRHILSCCVDQAYLDAPPDFQSYFELRGILYSGIEFKWDYPKNCYEVYILCDNGSLLSEHTWPELWPDNGEQGNSSDNKQVRSIK